MAAEEAASGLAAENEEREISLKPVELSTEGSWITPEELNDPDLECWLVRVPQHDSLKRNLIEKAIPLATKGAKAAPVMGSYIMNVRSMPHNKGIAGPSTEALPTLAIRGQNKKGKAGLQFGPQFSKFISVEFRMPIQRDKAPPPPKVYPKVPDGLHVQFPSAGKNWGRISTGSPRGDDEETPGPTVEKNEPGNVLSSGVTEKALASTQTNSPEAKGKKDEQEIQFAPSSEVQELSKVVEIHDEAKGEKGHDLDQIDLKTKTKESVKTEPMLNSPKKVREQGNDNESGEPDGAHASKERSKERMERKRKGKHGESVRKKEKRKKRKSEVAELRGNWETVSKVEQNSIPKEEPVMASDDRSSKKKKRRRSEADGDNEKKKKRKKKRQSAVVESRQDL